MSLITFGIYSVLHSKKRIKKLETKLCEEKKIIEKIRESISSYENKVTDLEEKILHHTENIEQNRQLMRKEISDIDSEYEETVRQVEPLPINLIESKKDDFIPLKKLAGMNYEKIVGCYVIRNIERNKYYVGQSKDVIKRVCHQHFDGTKVKNIIFAEDYYSSSMENKDDMFEVRIIRLETKDELDRKENELIEEYDSFNTGYNGTNGNQ